MLPVITNERTMFSLAMDNRLFGAGFGLAVNCLLSLAALRCEAQGNLIPNPSFEEADTCAVQLGFFTNGKPLYWESIDETPDYFRSCVPPGSVNGVPMNTVGFQVPQEGDSYAGLAAYLVSDLREMMYVELEEPLTVGQTYYGGFWANAAYGGQQQTGSACDKTGMLFTMSAEPWVQDGLGFALRNYAQIYSQEVISDTAVWTLVSGSFVADSAYQFMVLGNHFSNANTTLQVIGPGNPNKAYVFIDGVCLSTDPAGCPMFTSTHSGTFDESGLCITLSDGSVKIDWGQLPISSVSVMDATGHRLYEERGLGRPQATLITGPWSAGCYLVVLQGNGERQVKKFVVMR